MGLRSRPHGLIGDNNTSFWFDGCKNHTKLTISRERSSLSRFVGIRDQHSEGLSHFIVHPHMASRALTRSSATAEKQRVSCACLPRLANWSCSAQNTAGSQRLYYFLTFKRSDSRSAGRKRILTWNSNSRSFKIIHFALSYRPTRGSVSSYKWWWWTLLVVVTGR